MANQKRNGAVVTITLPTEVLEAIDAQVAMLHTTRSGFIAMSCMDKIRGQELVDAFSMSVKQMVADNPGFAKDLLAGAPFQQLSFADVPRKK